MKTVFALSLFLCTAGTALADIPYFRAVCPGPVSVRAEAGGPVMIDDAPADILMESKYAFEARHGAITVSVMIHADASLSVSFTGPGDAEGVCVVGRWRPVDRAEQL